MSIASTFYRLHYFVYYQKQLGSWSLNNWISSI